MEGLLVSSLFLLCLLIGGGSADQITLVPPPPRDLGSNVEIAFPPHKPDPWKEWDNITAIIAQLIAGEYTTAVPVHRKMWAIYAMEKIFVLILQ